MKLSCSLLALGFLATAMHAQGVPGISRRATGGTPQRIHYDLDTGVIREVSTPPAGALGAGITSPCFENDIDDDLYLDALLFPAGDELFDWGIKACSGSDLVQTITIGFASMAVPVQNGGPGGSLTLRIYEGGRGFGIAGTERLKLELTGLPSEGFVPPGEVLIPFSMTVDLGSQAFYLPTGPIAWSYENPDGQTAPLLVDVILENGTQNYFDVYRPGPASDGNLLGTFNLPPGGASNDFFENSFSIVLNESDQAGSQTNIPAGANPNVFTATRPVLGQAWTGIVNQFPFPTSTGTLVALSRERLNGVQTAFGELVYSPGTSILPISVLPGNVHDYMIPIDATLLGREFFAQGGVLEPSQTIVLTNARRCVIGAF